MCRLYSFASLWDLLTRMHLNKAQLSRVPAFVSRKQVSIVTLSFAFRK
jgi:hypothetical protein